MEEKHPSGEEKKKIPYDVFSPHGGSPESEENVTLKIKNGLIEVVLSCWICMPQWSL